MIARKGYLRGLRTSYRARRLWVQERSLNFYIYSLFQDDHGPMAVSKTSIEFADKGESLTPKNWTLP